MKSFWQTAAMLATLVVFALAIAIGCKQKQEISADPRPFLAAAQGELEKQNAALKSANEAMEKQVLALQSALTAILATGTFIDQAKALGASALAAGAAIPDVVTNLTQQAGTLDQAKSSNATAADQLRSAQDENARLKELNGALALHAAALAAQLKTALEVSAAGETEKTELRGRVAVLEKQLEDGRLEKLYSYFGWSIGVLVAGIAMSIWIPAPLKKLGFIVATIGAAGLAVTIFLIDWMPWFKWPLLVVFVGAVGFAAWSAWRNRGALTKTFEGVDGIKQDLQQLATGGATAEVRQAAAQVLVDWFGSADKSLKGVFHSLHSEFQGIVAGVREFIGSKPAIGPNARASVNGPGNGTAIST